MTDQHPASHTVTTPSEQQLYDKLSPELRKQVDAKRNAGARQAAYAEQVAVSTAARREIS